LPLGRWRASSYCGARARNNKLSRCPLPLTTDHSSHLLHQLTNWPSCPLLPLFASLRSGLLLLLRMSECARESENASAVLARRLTAGRRRSPPSQDHFRLSSGNGSISPANCSVRSYLLNVSCFIRPTVCPPEGGHEVCTQRHTLTLTSNGGAKTLPRCATFDATNLTARA
jgi:hypothetical protein